MEKYLLSPPVVFVILLIVVYVMYASSAVLAFRRKSTPGGLEKAYTGGENVGTHRVQPDYSQFFPFAFFFTILHVVTLVLTTVPIATLGSFVIAVIYMLGAILGLRVLFRR